MPPVVRAGNLSARYGYTTYLGRVVRKGGTTAVVYAILPAVDEERVEMDVGPTHHELEDVVEIGNGTAAADQYAPPDGGANFAQPNPKLINFWR